MKRIFIILLFMASMLSINEAFATNYYIDCMGSNSNNGTTMGTPWANFIPTQTTNFLKPGDIINVKTDCTFTGTSSQAWIYSTGNPISPIVIQPYGGGADPMFDASVSPSVDVPSWTGWDAFDLPNGVYVSHVPIPWVVNSINIDGTSSLKRFHSGQNVGTLSTNIGISMFVQTAINQPIYLRLSDSSDPNTHTIKFGRYGNGDTDGHTRGQFGVHDSTEAYVNISHIQLIGSNAQGFSSGAPYINFYNCNSFASAREAFYLEKAVVQNSTGGAYNTINNSSGSWSNSNFGQQFTIESHHVDLIDVVSSNSWQAGIDWLDYPATPPFTGPDVYDDRCIRCISYNNSRRAIYQDPNGNDPAGYYIDGAHNIQIINSVGYIDDTLLNSVTTANAISVLTIGAEHPTTEIPINIDVIGSLMYSNNYRVVLAGGAINCSGTACNVFSNFRFIGNTFTGNNGSGTVGFFQLSPTGLGVYFYNNVIQNLSSARAVSFTTSTGGPINSDNNVYKNSNGNVINGGTLAAWKISSGQDSVSLSTDPLFVGSGTIGGIIQTKHLSSIASGQGSDSPALALGYPNYLGNQYVFSSIGTVRTDSVTDNVNAPASGYHYLAQFVSSTFPSTQVGTDYQ